MAIKDPIPSLPRLDLPTIGGWMGKAWRTKWRLSAPSSRRKAVLRLCYQANWMDYQESGLALAQMRALVDMGIVEEDGSSSSFDSILNPDSKRAMFDFETAIGHVIDKNLPFEILHLLIEAGADCNRMQHNSADDTPLTRAVRHGRIEHVKVLLQAGADISQQDSCDMGVIALTIRLAGFSDKSARPIATEMMRVLLDGGADPNSNSNFTSTNPFGRYKASLLVEAACVHWLEGMDMLLEHGASGHYLSPHDGKNDFHNFFDIASRSYNESAAHCRATLGKLQNSGADINLVANDGSTPLLLAVESCSLRLTQALLELGAKHDAHDIDRWRSIGYLVARNFDFSQDDVKELIEKLPPGVWMEMDKRGMTPLDWMYKDSNPTPRHAQWIAWFEALSLERSALQEVGEVKLTPRPRARL